MELRFAPRGIIEIDNARVIFRNFSGKPSQYNREGDRNFAVVIPTQEQADALIEDGWNVKIKAPREEGDEPFRYLPVKVKFNERGPVVKLISGNNQLNIDEDTVGQLDYIDIATVDMDIRPFDWEVRGETGRTAYLQKMYVTQQIDRFADRYADYESPEE